MNRRWSVLLFLAGCQGSMGPAAPTSTPDGGEPDPPVVLPPDAGRADRLTPDLAPPLPPDAAVPTADTAHPPASLDGPMPVAGWWNAQWTRRRPITVVHPGKEALVDFVVPVQLPSGTWGDDLRFVAGDAILLDHELERSGMTTVAWVRVPRIAAGADGVAFTAYYGNPTAPARPGQVWTAPHAGVWHFAGDAKDATANHQDGAKTQVRFQSGAFGSGAAFDYARREHVSLVTDTKLISGAAAVTVSAWVMHAGTVHDGQDIILGIGTADTDGHLSRVSVAISPELGLIGEANPDEQAWDVISSPPGSVPNGELHHLAVVIDVPARTIQLYKDGVALRAPFKGGWSAKAYAGTPANRITVGCEEDESKSFFTGVIDELRVATTARSAEWLAAEARSLKMAAVGAEQKAP
jgi:hypothetical protein